MAMDKCLLYYLDRSNSVVQFQLFISECDEVSYVYEIVTGINYFIGERERVKYFIGK